MSNLVESMTGCVDSILSIREKLGADLRHVYLVTRTWTGRTPGEGTYTDAVEEIKPVPALRELKHDRRVKDGGTATEGDLLIYHISKNQYPTDDLLSCASSAKNIEKFYKIGKFTYTVLKIQERYITWDIEVRRRTDQRGA